MATIRVDSVSTPGKFKIAVSDDFPQGNSRYIELTDSEAGIIAALINEVFADRKNKGQPALTDEAQRELAWSVLGKAQDREATS